MIPAYEHVSVLRPREVECTSASVFGDLARNAREELAEISTTLRYPAGIALFTEGEPSRGIFILRSGRVKLFLCSGEGKTLILRMGKPGDLLGLPGTLSGDQYEVTAETLGPCQLTFIKRELFLRFMNAHKEVCLAVAGQLSQIYNSACHELRCLGLSHSAREKLAKLLLEWPLSPGDTPTRIKFAFRHEEVAQMIGTSRETVSRLFAEFKRWELVELNGSTLHFHNRASLQAVTEGKFAAAKFAAKPTNGNGNGNGSNGEGKSHPSTEQRVGRKYSDSDFHADGV